MKRGLKRLLQIRELLEELAQLDYETRAAVQRGYERGAERQAELNREARGGALARLHQGAATPEWLMGLSDAELLAWKRDRLAEMAVAATPAVESAREELLERRSERRQVEVLLANAARAEAEEEVRREQQLADDWFQSRSARQGGRD
jgi:flagellar export protein FliJ